MTHVVLLLWSMLGAPPAASSSELASAHAARAAELWDEGDLRGASRELEAAYALDPLPKYLYGLGTIAKQDDDCPRAIGYFERYLDSLPQTSLADEGKRDEIATQVAAEIVDCGGSPRAPTPPPPVVVPPPAARAPIDDTPPEPTPVPRVHWSRDPAGATCLAIGTAAISAGVGLLVAGAVIDRNVPQQDSARDFVAARTRAHRLGIAGAVVLPIGGAWAIAAIVRYAIVARRGGATRRSAVAFTGLGLRW